MYDEKLVHFNPQLSIYSALATMLKMKMKIYLTISLILTLCFSKQGLLAQELIPFESNGLYGYKNELGEVSIEPQYQYARKFNENYAVVAQNDSLGIINRQNKQIIPTKYHYLRYVGNEKFVFGYRAKYFGEYNLGLITSQNKIILQPQYYHIRPKKDIFIVKKQSYKIIDSLGIYDSREITNKYGIVDGLGNAILEPVFSWIEFLSNNFIIARKELNGNYALFDNKFKQLTEFKYMVIGDFYDGLSKVRDGDAFGYINTKGEEVIKCQ